MSSLEISTAPRTPRGPASRPRTAQRLMSAQLAARSDAPLHVDPPLPATPAQSALSVRLTRPVPSAHHLSLLPRRRLRALHIPASHTNIDAKGDAVIPLDPSRFLLHQASACASAAAIAGVAPTFAQHPAAQPAPAAVYDPSDCLFEFSPSAWAA